MVLTWGYRMMRRSSRHRWKKPDRSVKAYSLYQDLLVLVQMMMMWLLLLYLGLVESIVSLKETHVLLSSQSVL